MAENIDRLEIQVQTQAQRANAELDKMASKLEKISSVLSKVNVSGLQGLANGIDRLSTSMQNMSNVKTADFTRLAKNIEKLGNINQVGINNTANALRQISSALTASTVSGEALKGLSDLANGISRLGYKSVSNAITNLPLLAATMKQFMATLSTAPQVSQNLIQMTNAMANLASQGSRYNSTIKSMGNAAKNLSRAHNEAYKNNINFLASLSKLTVGFYILRRAVRASLEPINQAMDYGETINLFQTSFKKIGMEAAQDAGMSWGSEAANAYAKNFINQAQSFNDKITEALSLDPNTIMNYQAVFAQMANAFGLTNKSVMNLSESFTMLGLDMASFFNLDVEEAMVKLRAGLAGETEPLRILGVDITEATLKMTALKYGITGTVSEMSQAAKTQLRWLAIMDQTDTVFGDMAKTIQSPANQMRILQQQWENFTRTLGQIFIPIVTTVLPYINAFVIALQRMASVIAGAMGYELPDYTGSDIYQDVTGDIGVIGDTADDSNKSVKELKKSLASFDELNILGDSKVKGINLNLNGGYDSLDDAISQKTNSYMTKFNEELEKAGNSAKDIAENIQSFFKTVGEKVEPTTKALKELWDDGLSKLDSFAGTNLVNFYNDFLVPVGSWVLGEGLPSLFNTINNFISNIDLISLNTALGELYNALAPFAESVGEGLINFIQSMAQILEPIVANTADLLAKAIKAIADGINLIPEKTAIAIGGAIGGIATSILLFNGASAIAGIVKNIGAAIGGMLTTISAHPVLVIAAGIGTLAGAVLALDKAKFEKSDLGQYISDLEELANNAKLFNDEVAKMLADHEERRSDIEAEYGAVQILADKYFALADQENRTNAENELLKSYAQELIGKIPELSGLIDEQTGAYKGTKEEINALIERTKEYYLVQAAQESLIEIAKKQYEADKQLKGLQDERAAAQQKLDEITAEYNKTLETSYSRSGTLTQEQKEAATKAIELSSQMTKLEKAIGELDTQIVNTKDTQSELNSEWNYAENYIKNYSSTAKTEMPKVETSVKTAYDNIEKEVSNFKLPELRTKLVVDTSALSGITTGYANTMKIAGPYIQQRASGGYVNDGQLFVARENGLTEMVGRIGNRAAVANNDQITDALEEAAYRGYVRAIADTRGYNNNTNVNITLEGDAKGLFKAVQKSSKEYYDMTGRSPFPA